MYKGVGWEDTTSGIINADQTKRGRIKRKVCCKGKGNPYVQMCRGGMLKICTRVSLISSFVSKRATGRKSKGGRVTVD